MNGKFISYCRVSTKAQGVSGLGLEAQRKAIDDYLNGGQWALVAEFVEVESGRNNKRPQLQKALDLCKKEQACLVIARLDRLSRNAAFLMNLMESKIKFVCVDNPNIDNFTAGILALVAQKEAENISARTKAGLQAAIARGKKLGGPKPMEAAKRSVAVRQAQAMAFAADMAPVIEDVKLGYKENPTFRELAACLNRRGYKTPNGKQFAPQSVKNLLDLIGNINNTTHEQNSIRDSKTEH